MFNTPINFDILLADGKHGEFNKIVCDFTKHLNVERNIDLIRVECLDMVDTGVEIKYKVRFVFGKSHTLTRYVNEYEYELNQSSFERLVALSCKINGIVNTAKYKHMIADIEIGIIDKRLHYKSIELVHTMEHVNVISIEIGMIHEHRRNLIVHNQMRG